MDVLTALRDAVPNAHIFTSAAIAGHRRRADELRGLLARMESTLRIFVMHALPYSMTQQDMGTVRERIARSVGGAVARTGQDAMTCAQ